MNLVLGFSHKVFQALGFIFRFIWLYGNLNPNLRKHFGVSPHRYRIFMLPKLLRGFGNFEYLNKNCIRGTFFFYSDSVNISACMWLKLFQEKNCCNKKLNILKLPKTLFFEGKCHSEEWVTYKHFLEDKIIGFPNTILLIGTKWVMSDGISYSIFSWWGRGRAVYSYFTGILSTFLITTIDLRIVNLFSYLE